MNAKMLTKFIRQLIKVTERKIFLILDNLRVHHAQAVQEWLKDYREKIELSFSPGLFPGMEFWRIFELRSESRGACTLTGSRYRWSHEKSARSHENIVEVTGQGERVLQPS